MESNDMVREREVRSPAYRVNGDVTRERDYLDVDTIRVAQPVDRVRWAAIFAGLFTTVSTFILLSILGLAIGATAFSPGDTLAGFGTGAGIWSAVSALLAFFIGGLIAARAAAVTGRGNGALNGAMVWIVMIPLALYLVSSGIGSTLQTLGGIASTGIQAAAPIVSDVADDVATANGITVQSVQATAEAAGQTLTEPDAQATVTAQVQAALPEVNQQQVDNVAESSTWGTFIALLLGLGAALLGGLAGGRRRVSHPAAVAA